MVDIFGNYESQQTRALQSIDSSKYPDTNKDMEATLRRTVEFVDYISQYLQVMQKGVDQANQDFIQRTREIVSNVVVLLGGGAITDVDLGDLQYFLPAIGALLGFDADTPFPINLFNAAERFFLGYVVPLDSFGITIQDMIIEWAETFGLNHDFIVALNELFTEFNELGTSVSDILNTVLDLFNIFGAGDNTGWLGPFGDLWHALSQLLGSFSLSDIGSLTDPIFGALAPWVHEMAQLVHMIDQVVRAFSGGLSNVQGLLNFGSMFTGFLDFLPSGDDFSVDGSWLTVIENILLPTNWFKNLSNFFGDFDLFGDLQTPQDVWNWIITHFLNPSGLLEAIGAGFEAIVKGLFGIDGGDEDLFDLLGTNLMSLFGGLNFNQPTGSFNPVAEAEKFIQSILTPAGALSSFTQIPQHLFGWLNGGIQTTIPNLDKNVVNLLPDPEFRDPEFLVGNGAWNQDGAVTHGSQPGDGSVHTTGASIVRQLLGVPIKVATGQVQANDLAIWVKWSGLTGGTGQAIRLIASAYDDDLAQNLISDPSNRVVSVISSPGASSASFTGTDAANNNRTLTKDSNNWVQLLGAYQPPAGTKFVRMTLEVQSNVSGGDVWFSSAMHSLDSIIDASRIGNLDQMAQIPIHVLEGLQGIAGLGDALQHLLDGLGSAFNPSSTVSGIDFGDLFGLAQYSTNSALEALEKAITSINILGIRTNKQTSSGVNNTSEAAFTLGHFSSGGTVTTATIPAGQAASQMLRVAEDSVKGFVEFLAYGTSITNVYINLYKVDISNGNKTAIWNSSNIAGQFTTSLAYIRALIPGGSQPAVSASDLLMVEIANNGSNTITIAAKNTGIPNHPTEIPKNFGAIRTLSGTGGATPSSLTDSQITYTSTLPYFNLGILAVPADYHAPVTYPFGTGARNTGGTFTFNIPSWIQSGDILDLVGFGAGGGGADSSGFLTGNGADAGSFNARTVIYGVDIPLAVTQLTVTVGKGGNWGGYNAGGDGTDTVISYTLSGVTTVLLTCSRGIGGRAFNSQQLTGLGPGTQGYNGQSYFGGSNVGSNKGGAIPGGGGGAGVGFSHSGQGADGAAWILARQAA